MKKFLIAVAVATTFTAPQAFAQAKNFEGFSVLGGINATSSDTDVSNSLAFAKLTGQTSSNATLQAQYSLALGSSFVLGVGGTYELGDIDVGNASGGGVTFSGKRKDAYSVYIAPGFAINDTWLVYGKVASISAKLETTGSAVLTGKTDLSGIGYGIGFQKLLSKNLYLQAEFIQNKYDDKTVAGTVTTKIKEESRTLSFGVGYKF